MTSARPVWTTSLTFLGIGAAMATIGAAGIPGPYGRLAWERAHMWVLIGGALLPALYFLHLHALGSRTGRPPAREMIVFLQGAIIAGTLILGAGVLMPAPASGPDPFPFVAFVGVLVLVLASIVQHLGLRQTMPPKGTTLAAPETDPLSKGDDACLKHIRMAHRILPIALLMLAVGFLPGLGDLQERLRIAGMHALLVGYGVLSIYGLGHLMVPRWSGVPAIAAGAIKGELHTTLLGLVGIVAGFLAGAESSLGRGLIVGLGPFVFLGMFVYMGVLGANIMKNKSRTQRVTPEFVYVPWTFTGVFWLVGAILLGVLINAVPDALSHLRPGLRFVHLHAAAVGGIVQLFIGWGYRTLAGGALPSFARTRGPFFGLNAGLVVMMVGALRSDSTATLVGAALTLAAILWASFSLRTTRLASRPEGSAA